MRDKIWLPKFLTGQPAQMLEEIRQMSGFKTLRTTLVAMITEKYDAIRETKEALESLRLKGEI